MKVRIMIYLVIIFAIGYTLGLIHGRAYEAKRYESRIEQSVEAETP